MKQQKSEKFLNEKEKSNGKAEMNNKSVGERKKSFLRIRVRHFILYRQKTLENIFSKKKRDSRIILIFYRSLHIFNFLQSGHDLPHLN